MLDQATSLIRTLFVTSHEEARVEAEGLLRVFSAHGTDAPTWELVENAIHKKLGARLEWRDPSLKAQLEKSSQTTVGAYNQHLKRTRRP